MINKKEFIKNLIYSRDDYILSLKSPFNFNLPIKAFPDIRKYITFNGTYHNNSRIIFTQYETFQFPAIKGFLIKDISDPDLERLISQDDYLDFIKSGETKINRFGNVNIPIKFREILNSKIKQNGIGNNNIIFRGQGNYFIIYRETDQMVETHNRVYFPKII